ncbi:MAG TPA: NAD(P)-dependent oxidoreductase, partial [Tepiditoga sp.]|nr:NAD(P)-dependent oxidoreductase [Tepiditoga sp.]
IDENYLYEKLKNRSIAGAGLDVYEFEPEITKGLTDLENVVLTPHIGSASIETRNRMSVMSASDIINVLEGKTQNNPVI